MMSSTLPLIRSDSAALPKANEDSIRYELWWVAAEHEVVHRSGWRTLDVSDVAGIPSLAISLWWLPLIQCRRR